MALKEYEVEITEILTRKVKVSAESYSEAEFKVEEEYKAQQHVLDESDFVCVNFFARKKGVEC